MRQTPLGESNNFSIPREIIKSTRRARPPLTRVWAPYVGPIPHVKGRGLPPVNLIISQYHMKLFGPPGKVYPLSHGTM
jgi:hypothetical protein